MVFTKSSLKSTAQTSNTQFYESYKRDWCSFIQTFKRHFPPDETSPSRNLLATKNDNEIVREYSNRHQKWAEKR